MLTVIMFVSTAAAFYTLGVMVGYPLLARWRPGVYAAYLDDDGWAHFTTQRPFGEVPPTFPDHLRARAADEWERRTRP